MFFLIYFHESTWSSHPLDEVMLPIYDLGNYNTLGTLGNLMTLKTENSENRRNRTRTENKRRRIPTQLRGIINLVP